ncbi:MAG: hypothetical protein LPK21_03970, partial [Hymenobacteraceae bacterium]|nr:hypothetical protein [Hymenobacteraceae bacterium]
MKRSCLQPGAILNRCCTTKESKQQQKQKHESERVNKAIYYFSYNFRNQQEGNIFVFSLFLFIHLIRLNFPQLFPFYA